MSTAVATSAADAVRTNPFPGLRPFREEEEYLFFGRERQVDAMVNKLGVTRFLAVVGSSGSGKSSLVNCGLRPALHRGLMTSAGPAWRIAQFRPGVEPLQALGRALAADGVLYTNYAGGIALDEIIDTHLQLSNLGLIDIFRKARLPQQVNLLVVVDRFEELFRYSKLAASRRGRTQYGPGEEAIAFVNLLLEAKSQTEFPIYVVLTMRSDFLGDCAQLPGLPEAINEGQYLVPRLTREERRAAIAGPVGVGGAEISPVLLTRLVNDVGDNPDQLSILQHALNRTWAYWQHQGRGEASLSLPHYEAIGTMAHALDQHAEKAYGELGSERQKKICEKIFKALTDKGTDARGIRRPTSLGTLCALAGASQAEGTEVINAFRKPSRSFLMPPLPEELEPATVIDISHESLMRVWQRLNVWAEEEAQSARIYRRVAETAALYAAEKAGLWRDPDLQLALDWRQKEEPLADWAELYEGGFAPAMAFLQKSKEVRDKERAEVEFERRWRRPLVMIVILCLTSFFVNLDKHGDWIHDNLLKDSFVHPLLQTLTGWLRLDERIERGLANALLGVPYLLGYLALAHFGKRVFRRLAFGKMVQEVALQSAAAPKKETVTPVPAAEILYAGFWRRFLAYSIDYVLFIILFLVLILILVVPGGGAEPSIAMMIALYAVLFSADWFYQAKMTSSARQATLGKMAVRILVTDKEGRRVSFARATGRYFAKILCYYSAVGFFIQPFTKKKQALHDLIAGTLVVRRPAQESSGPAT